MHRKKEMDSYWQHEFVQLIFPIVVRTKGCTIVDPEPLQPYFGDNVSQSGAYDRLRGQGVVEVCVCVCVINSLSYLNEKKWKKTWKKKKKRKYRTKNA